MELDGWVDPVVTIKDFLHEGDRVEAGGFHQDDPTVPRLCVLEMHIIEAWTH